MEQEQKKRKASYMEKLKTRKPDLDFNDEEAVFGAIDDYETERDGRLKRFEDESSRLVDMMSRDPRMVDFITRMAAEENPLLAIVDIYGPDFMEAAQDESMREKLAAKSTEWLERVSSSRQLEEEANTNLSATLDTLDRLQQENGWSNEQAQEIFNQVNTIISEGVVNKISPETFLMISKALNYDNAVNDARELGQIRGRNERIEERLRKRNEQPNTPPSLSGAKGSSGGAKKTKTVFNPFVVGGKREIEIDE